MGGHVRSAGRWLQRAGAALFLVVLGVLSLPLVAMVFDEAGQERWIIPVQVALMTLVGVGVGLLVPALAGADATRTRRAVVGALIALVGVAISLVLFVVLLNGIGGL